MLLMQSPNCVKHMQIDKYSATHAEVYDEDNGELHAVVKRSINGDVHILFKREVQEGV